MTVSSATCEWRPNPARTSVNDLVLQLKGLVLVRDLLEIRGATRAEIDEHTAEIERVTTDMEVRSVKRQAASSSL